MESTDHLMSNVLHSVDLSVPPPPSPALETPGLGLAGNRCCDEIKSEDREGNTE